MNSIFHLIDRLERLLGESWGVPLSAYRVVNEADFLDVIDQMRTAIPQEIKQGERITQEKERIIAQAQEEAERIVGLAQEEAARLIDEHEIVKTAEQRRATIIERAQQEAEILKGGADAYAHEVLVALDGQLANILTTVRNGLASLNNPAEQTPAE
ncbi:MAG: ATPase [Anaerolineae bacterium]|nr:ATPase [Anaerolineae bacterium]